MAQFMLLLRGGDFTKYTPKELDKIREEYFSFSTKLNSAGKRIAGEELKDSGRSISLKEGKPVVVDGPFAESKEIIGGFWLITEKDLDAATETARACPHLKYGGVVEVREINPHPN